MIVPKGYRAREAAAKLRNNRRLVSEEVRAQRAAMLPDYAEGDETVVAAEAKVPADNPASTSTSDPADDAAIAAAAEKEAAEKAAAEKEAAEKAAAEKAAAEKAATEKEAAEKAAAAKKAKAKADKAKDK
jgi:colicin import membrane protein